MQSGEQVEENAIKNDSIKKVSKSTFHVGQQKLITGIDIIYWCNRMYLVDSELNHIFEYLNKKRWRHVTGKKMIE